jgi:hypothetical protein
MMRLLERAVWSVLLVWVCEVWWGIYLTVGQAGETARRKPRLKARRPEDCPACQSRQGLRGVNSRPTQAVRPWSEVKGKEGRKKQSNTEGTPVRTGRAGSMAIAARLFTPWCCRKRVARRARSGAYAARRVANASPNATTQCWPI